MKEFTDGIVSAFKYSYLQSTLRMRYDVSIVKAPLAVAIYDFTQKHIILLFHLIRSLSTKSEMNEGRSVLQSGLPRLRRHEGLGTTA